MAKLSDESFAQILALDDLTLREHTEKAGVQFDLANHAEKHRASLDKSKLTLVRRSQAIIAYANLWRVEGDTWFAGMINVHPKFRNASVLRELFTALRKMIAQHNIKIIKSNVYKTNVRSIAFHKKLGFDVTRENEVGFEFTLIV